MDRHVEFGLVLLCVFFMTGCTGQNDYSDEFRLSEEAKESQKLTLKFARVPSVTVTELLRQNAPLIRILKEKLDVNITYRFADSYQGIIEGMSEESYDFTWLGPYSYVLSECASNKSASYKPLVRPLRRNQAGELSGEYRGIIFTRQDLNVSKLSDLQGKRFAFTEKLSTSGYLFPMALLMDSRLDPSQDFKEIQFLKRHDKVVKAVIEGKADVGATYNDARMEEFNTKTEANRQLPIITKTKPIPTSPITVSEKFSRNHPELVEKFVNVMTNLHNSDKGREILETLSISQYQPAKNSDYDQVREVLGKLRTTLPRVQNICQKPLTGSS